MFLKLITIIELNEKTQMNTSLLSKSIFLVTCIFTFTSYGQNLNEHKWKNRVLIVKTLKKESKKFVDQIKEFKSSDKGLKERKLVLYKIRKDEFSLIDFANKDLNYSGKIKRSWIANLLDGTNDFEVLLIGLDGGVKLQQTEVLTKEKLYSIIDSMPMRKNEIRN